MNFRDYKRKLRKRASNDDWETEEVSRWIMNDEGLYDAAYDAVRRDYMNPAGALRNLVEMHGLPNVDLDLVDWDTLVAEIDEDTAEQMGYDASQMLAQDQPGDTYLPEGWTSKAHRISMSHGLVPCPDCGGDIQHRSGNCRICRGMGQRLDSIGLSGRPQYEHEPCPACHGSGQGDSWFECANCRRTWDDSDQAYQEIMPGGIPCPKCGSDMYEQHNSPLFKDGAWECSNQGCWHMMPLGDVVPDAPPQDWQ